MTIAHFPEPLRARPPITRLQFVQYLLCQPLYIMITLMVTEALLAALTTWLMIRAGRAVTNDTFTARDLIWIFVAQSASYLAGALSWYFAERAGFRAFGRYMLQFARDNRSYTRLLSDVPHQHDLYQYFQFHVRSGGPAQAAARPYLQFDRAGRGDRRGPTGRLCGDLR